MTDKIERGHVCEHGIRWPHACQPCDDAAWAQRDPKSPPQPAVSVEQCASCGGTRDTCMGAIMHADRCEVMLNMRRASAAPPADGVLREALKRLKFQVDFQRGYGSDDIRLRRADGDTLFAALSAAPKSPTAPIGEVGKGLREAVCAGLRAWIASTPDIDLSSRMISDAADFIIGQPLAERGGFEAGIEALEQDKARLDALAGESWDLRCFDVPTGGDDADIGWRVIGHWMAEPRERIIGEVYHDNPRAAIDQARARLARGEGE